MNKLFDAQALTTRLALNAEAIKRAHNISTETGERLDRVLMRLGTVKEREVVQALAHQLAIPVVETDHYPLTPVLTVPLAERFLRTALVLPLSFDDHKVDLAMVDPFNQTTINAVSLATGREVKVNVAVQSELEAALARLYGQQDSSLDSLLTALDPTPEADTSVERLRDLASEAPIVRMVNQLMGQAVQQRASDIHLEPFESQLRIRFRIDGVLVEHETLPKRHAAAIVSRIKLMAGLDIAERRLPQDGRIKWPVRGQDVDFRVATSPSLHGESVTLRILDFNQVPFDFEQLGLSPEVRHAFMTELNRPNGIILVTGPTGSGKTTTLYTALTQLNQPSRKVITVEDPIEYQIHGVNQIQIKPDIGLGFAESLRSILRHDPDTIMIGEIRDLETAQIAIQSALTGHLVLSTLHTNGAWATVTRLLDLGVPDYLVTATLRAVVAQRLVRKLCLYCRSQEAITAERAQALGLPAQATTLYHPQGCEHCHGTGYLGRVGLFEILPITPAVKEWIMAHRSGQEAFPHSGYHSLHQDGVAKVLAGITSLEEVWRVVVER